jgi:hypothetical protein
MVAYANIREIMSSDVRQKLREFQATSPDGSQHRFQDETGIDFEKDIDYVVASGAGAQDAGTEDRPLLLARGRFDAVRIEGLIRERGGSVEDYHGKRLFTQPDMRMAVTFVEPDLVAVGSLDAVRRAVDTKAGSLPDVKGNADVMRLVREVDNGTAWAVARFDAISPRLSGGLAPQLPPINWFAVTSHIDSGVRGTMHAETRDEASAQNLQEVIRGMMALARMQVGQHAELSAFVDSLELSGNGNTVTLGFSVPAEMIDMIGSQRASRPRAAPERQDARPRSPSRQPPSSPPAL